MCELCKTIQNMIEAIEQLYPEDILTDICKRTLEGDDEAQLLATFDKRNLWANVICMLAVNFAYKKQIPDVQFFGMFRQHLFYEYHQRDHSVDEHEEKLRGYES